MADAYEVKTPLVLVRDESGATQYLYQGAHIPSYVKADRVKELLDEGHIAKVGAPDPNEDAKPEDKAPAAKKAVAAKPEDK